MFEIKFFGWIRNEVGVSKLTMSERTVIETLEEIIKTYPQIDKTHLMNSILFINKKPIIGKKRLTMILKDGDELAILSPVSGG
ncbi:MAG: MoaD/ThiS family protein [Clostridia bacterium]|nr:MoaD/ThiS family protein [Clostridia bacterium]